MKTWIARGICQTATLLAHVSSGSTEIWKFNFVSGLEQTCRWLLLNDLSINVYVLALECAAIKLLDFSSLAVNGISKIPYSFVLVCIVCTAIIIKYIAFLGQKVCSKPPERTAWSPPNCSWSSCLSDRGILSLQKLASVRFFICFQSSLHVKRRNYKERWLYPRCMWN